MRRSLLILFVVIGLTACSSTQEVTPQDVISQSEMASHDGGNRMPEMVGGERRLYEVLQYPDHARSDGQQGMVVLSYTVNQNGRVRDIEVAESSGHRLLDRAAARALRQMRFTPGVIDGEPVDVQMTRPVIYRLN